MASNTKKNVKRVKDDNGIKRFVGTEYDTSKGTSRDKAAYDAFEKMLKDMKRK